MAKDHLLTSNASKVLELEIAITETKRELLKTTHELLDTLRQLSEANDMCIERGALALKYTQLFTWRLLTDELENMEAAWLKSNSTQGENMVAGYLSGMKAARKAIHALEPESSDSDDLHHRAVAAVESQRYTPLALTMKSLDGWYNQGYCAALSDASQRLRALWHEHQERTKT